MRIVAHVFGYDNSLHQHAPAPAASHTQSQREGTALHCGAVPSRLEGLHSHSAFCCKWWHYVCLEEKHTGVLCFSRDTVSEP